MLTREKRILSTRQASILSVSLKVYFVVSLKLGIEKFKESRADIHGNYRSKPADILSFYGWLVIRRNVTRTVVLKQTLETVFFIWLVTITTEMAVRFLRFFQVYVFGVKKFRFQGRVFLHLGARIRFKFINNKSCQSKKKKSSFLPRLKVMNLSVGGGC